MLVFEPIPMGQHRSMLLNMGSTDFILQLKLIFICCTWATGKWKIMLCWASEINAMHVFVKDSSGVKWSGKSNRIAVVVDLVKRQHNTVKSGIPSPHGHFHLFCPLYQLAKAAQLFAPHKSCDRDEWKELCQPLFRPWSQPWLRSLDSRLVEPALRFKIYFELS